MWGVFYFYTMTTFIDELKQSLIQANIPFEKLTVVLPSKRAGTVLKNKLVQEIPSESSFLPQIIGIEELIEDMSGLSSCDSLELLLELYSVYAQYSTQTNKDSFLEFMSWGQTLLADFNEIDHYLINTTDFFNYLKAVKDLNHWSLQADEKPLIADYIKFWHTLPDLYAQLNKTLLAENKGYQGMLYRKAAERANIYISEEQGHFVFAGFNALNAAEQLIIQEFLEQKKADIIWDIDTHFLSESNNAVSHFIKSYYRNWPQLKDQNLQQIGRNNFNTNKTIFTYSAAQQIGQVKWVGNLLENQSTEELQQTAVVLGEESQLLPLLNSLPENVQALNVTMGIPLKQIPDTAFYSALFQMQQNNNTSRYHYKDVLALINQPLTKRLLGTYCDIIKTQLVKNNYTYIPVQKLIELCAPIENIASALFALWENNSGTALLQINFLIKELKSTHATPNRFLQIEYLNRFEKLFSRLQELVLKYSFISSVKALALFYESLLAEETLDLIGSPYTGLQIMGVLESRTLDFKNVIITALNEGTLPSGKTQNSYIPFDLKVEYKLPTYREKDSIYAYHFFRLLQRAENVHLLYNNQAEGLSSGEKSRFILQLEADQTANFNYKEIAVVAPTILKQTQLKHIEKSPAILEKLAAHAQSGFSPSALTTYIRNPYDFYTRYVLGVKEVEEVEETVAFNTLGTVVHQALENLYDPFLNTMLSVPILEQILKKVHQEVHQQFEKEYGLENLETGKNLIIFNVAKQFVINFIQMEKRAIEDGNTIAIKELEANYKIGFTTKLHSVNLRGSIDRIDLFNDTLRIIDYKTGRVEPAQLKINDWDLLIEDYTYSKAFQVLNYALLLSKSGLLTPNTEAGIFSFKNIGSGFMKFNENKNSYITEEVLQRFEIELGFLIDEILDPEKPFMEKLT